MPFLDQDSSEWGGKGQGLKRAQSLGLPVPEFVVLSRQAFMAQVNTWPPLQADGMPTLADLRQAQSHLTLSPAICQEILHALPVSPTGEYAVRSSARGEDGGDYAFAGLFDSFLQVRACDVPLRVLDCWLACFRPEVWEYLRLHQLPVTALEMAVVIQVQIESEVSGVFFQVDPQGSLNDHVIVAAAGLGSGVVEGSSLSETYRRDCFETQWQRQLLSETPLLDTAECESLVKWGKRLWQATGQFQDLEWCKTQGKLYLLQARAITGLAPGPYTLYDCSNIQESYPGVVLPLSASLVKRGYATNFSHALRLAGFSAHFIAARAEVVNTLIASIEGRLYYHVPHWLKVLSWVPGLQRLTQGSFETMISRSDLSLVEAEQGPWWVLPRLLVCLLALPLAMKHNQARFEQAYQMLSQWDSSCQNAQTIFSQYDKACDTFLPFAAWPLLNDLLTGLLLRVLKKSLGHEDTLLPALLAGLPGVVSQAPWEALRKLALYLSSQELCLSEIKDCVEQKGLEATWSERERWPDLASACEQYLQTYGARSLDELKLEQPSLREAPHEFLALLLAEAQYPSAVVGGSQQAIMARERLKQKWSFWHPGWFLIQQTRHALWRREQGRFNRTRTLGQARRLLRDVAQRLVETGHLAQADDVHYLSEHELRVLLMQSDESPLALIESRRRQYAYWQHRQPRERLLLGTQRDEHLIAQQNVSPLNSHAQGCAGGEVQGPVIVLHQPRPDADVKGKILVTVLTDPGWIFLLARAKGLIVERGNLLSHAAICARELGLPTVVGLKGATQWLETGDWVYLNGQSGEVRRIEPPV